MLRLVLTLVLVAVPLSLLAAPVPKDKGRTYAQMLIGNWKLTGGSEENAGASGLEIEFRADGKLLLKQTNGTGGAFIREGVYKLKDDKIDYEVKTPPFTKQEILTIKKLTETHLAFVDPDGIREEFDRVPEPKK